MMNNVEYGTVLNKQQNEGTLQKNCNYTKKHFRKTMKLSRQ